MRANCSRSSACLANGSEEESQVELEHSDEDSKIKLLTKMVGSITSSHQYDDMFHSGCPGNDATLPLSLYLVLEFGAESHHSISEHRCRTISLETGAQNIQMCVTMLQLSFTAKQLVQMFSFPLAYGLFQLLDGFLIIAAYQIYKRRLRNKHRPEDPACAEACEEMQITSPPETSTFLEVKEEATEPPGPWGSVALHRLSSELATSLHVTRRDSLS